MKIELDLATKTLSVSGKVKISELMTEVKRLLPDWENWSIEQKTETIFLNPTEMPIGHGEYSPPFIPTCIPSQIPNGTTATC